MVVHKSLPMFKVTTNYSGSSYDFINDQFISGRITRVENGLDIATLWMNDYQSLNWLNKVAADEDINIYFKDASEGSWTEVFDGIVRFINTPLSAQGEMLELKCDGAAYPLMETSCGQEYGTESTNPTYDKLQEIIAHAGAGIVDNWVEKILGGAASGYTLIANTDTVEDIVGSINYLYFPYKDCLKAIDDVCDLVQAIKGAAAGPHWIVTTDNKLCVSTVGTHHAGVIAEGWTTYYGGSQAASTLEQGKDFIEFYFQELAKEANYILYHGRLQKPGNGDFWTENQSGLWGHDANTTMGDDNADFKVGAFSLTGQSADPNHTIFYYPSGMAANWEIDDWGGQYNVPTISYWVKRDASSFDNFYVRIGTGNNFNNNYYQRLLSLTAGEWTWASYDIGPYANVGSNPRAEWTVGAGAPDWHNIDWVGFRITPLAGQTTTLKIDGFKFNGWILRGARETTIDATNPLKLKPITDDVAKDDSGVASDDTGTLARLAKAELYRCKTTPIVGFAKTPIIKDALPGQLFHTHAKQKADGSFNLDKDMRSTKLVHDFSANGFLTTFFLTDDVTNFMARDPFNAMNMVLKASRPEFQDRQASSIKAREIDITQTIMVTSY